MDTGFRPSSFMAGYLRQIGPDQAVKLARELCSQLEDDPDSFHGGIWPGNIDIDAEGKAVLGPANRTEASRRPADQVEYLAPEHFWDNETSAAADVYSIGLLLYAGCCGGYLPFQEGDGEPTAKDRSAALRRRMKGETIIAPEGVSDELKKVMERSLAYEPERRYITAREFLTALGRTDEALPTADAGAAAAALAAGIAPLPEEDTDKLSIPEPEEASEGAPAADEAETEPAPEEEISAPEEDAPEAAEVPEDGEAPAADELPEDGDQAAEQEDIPAEADASVPAEDTYEPAWEEPAPEEEISAPEEGSAPEPAEAQDAPAPESGDEQEKDIPAAAAAGAAAAVSGAAAAAGRDRKKRGRSKRNAKAKTPADSGRIARVSDSARTSARAASKTGPDQAAPASGRTQYRVQKDFEGSPRMRNVRNTGPATKKKSSAVIPVLCGVAAAVLMGSVGYMTYGFLAQAPEVSQVYTTPSSTETPAPATDTPEPTATPRPTHTPRPTPDPDATPDPLATPGAGVNGVNGIDANGTNAAGTNANGAGTNGTAAASTGAGAGIGTGAAGGGTGAGSAGGTSSGGSSTGGGSSSSGGSNFNVSAASGTMYVTAAIGVNVRSGPGTGYSILGTLKQNAAVTRTGTVASGWTRVQYNGGTGYIFTQYLSETKPTPAPTPAPSNSKTSFAACLQAAGQQLFAPIDAQEAEEMITAIKALKEQAPALKYVWLGLKYEDGAWKTLSGSSSYGLPSDLGAATETSRVYLTQDDSGEWTKYVLSPDGTIPGAVDEQVGYLID